MEPQLPAGAGPAGLGEEPPGKCLCSPQTGTLEGALPATPAGLPDQTALEMWGPRLEQALQGRKNGSFVQELTEATGREDPGLWDLRLEMWVWGDAL